MVERADNQETGQIFGPEGLPLDLYTNPAKYDADISLWKRTVGFVKQYQNTRPQKREAFLDQTASPLVKDLQTMKHVIENLELAAQIQTGTDIKVIQSELTARIDAAAAKRSNLSNWTPQRIDGLIQLGFGTSRGVAEVAERIKRALFNAPRTPAEAVNLQFNAAWVMVSTGDNQIREELFSILCFEKPWFSAQSLGNFYFTLGSSFPDDATWEKYNAVIGALNPVGFLLETKGEFIPTVSKRVQGRDLRLLESLSLISESEQIAREKIVLQYAGQNPQRFARIKAYTLSKEDEIYDELLHPKGAFEEFKGKDLLRKSQEIKEARKKAENLPWPKNILYNQKEPLNTLVREVFLPKVYRTFWESFQRATRERGFEKITDRPLQLTDDLVLDIIGKDSLTVEQKQDLVREVRTAVVSTDPNFISPRASQSFAGILDLARAKTCTFIPFDRERNIWFNVSLRLPEEEIGRLSSILEYHRPMFTVEQVGAIEDQINCSREDLQKGFTRSIGRRGYALLVTDPYLKRLGYEKITVNQTAGNRIHVRIQISGEEYRFDLNEGYKIVLGHDLKQIKNAQDKAWLEILTLSHLKKVMCTEEEEEKLKAELVGGEKQYEKYRRQIGGRTEHLRKQTPGWNYRTRAFELCLKSHLPVKNLRLEPQNGLSNRSNQAVSEFHYGLELLT